MKPLPPPRLHSPAFFSYKVKCIAIWHRTINFIAIPFSTACLQDLYILAFTSGRKGAGSDKAHEVEVRAAGQTKVIKLPNLPGDDYKKNKGDLWKLTFRGDLKFTRCVTLRNLDHIAIEAGSNDGWNIDSIVTFVRAHGSFRLITRNFNAFRWIDGNGPASHRRFKLRNVY